MTDLPRTDDLSDDALRERGLRAPAGTMSDADVGERCLIIACGALAREILALIALNQLSHVTLACLPAKLHNTPADIPDAVEAAVNKHKNDYDQILVAYGDCGTGGLLQAVCARLGVTMIDSPHCYAFFNGTEDFTARGEVTSFYLTDFLTRQFDTLVWVPLGLDRYPDLLETYFGNYEKLVYLAQTEDATLTEAARDAAARLGLAFERRDTGYGDLARFVQGQL